MRLCPLRGLWRDWVPLTRRLNAAPSAENCRGTGPLDSTTPEYRLPTPNTHPPNLPVRLLLVSPRICSLQLSPTSCFVCQCAVSGWYLRLQCVR
ncbi:hypothetical protein BDW75DRAFT_209034 [Aspergillus navahoensis]